jgi:hypothetical protein
MRINFASGAASIGWSGSASQADIGGRFRGFAGRNLSLGIDLAQSRLSRLRIRDVGGALPEILPIGRIPIALFKSRALPIFLAGITAALPPARPVAAPPYAGRAAGIRHGGGMMGPHLAGRGMCEPRA